MYYMRKEKTKKDKILYSKPALARFPGPLAFLAIIVVPTQVWFTPNILCVFIHSAFSTSSHVLTCAHNMLANTSNCEKIVFLV